MVTAHTARARELRKRLTKQEARLWLRLRRMRAEGYHFRRQAPFRGYYLDFVCFSHRVIIELDGGGHGEDAQAAHDRVRDAVLQREGFQVLRIWNHQVNEDITDVMDYIRGILSRATPTRPLRGHPPHEGEGGSRRHV